VRSRFARPPPGFTPETYLIPLFGSLPRTVARFEISPGLIQTAFTMPQLQLPIFLDGVHNISADVGYEKRDGKIVYYCGSMPVFSHDEDDMDSFRTITSQLYVNGNVSQAAIVRAFDIKGQALKRWVKRYQTDGPGTFFKPRETRGKATVLTPLVLEKAQAHLDNGLSVSQVAATLEISYDTVRKAVSDGRLTKQKKTKSPPHPPK
jgi:transposase-like protein